MCEKKKQPLIVLTGPTSVGKTALSISLAKKINGEIISADSMQVYKYMDIGSAKIKKTEMCDIPHHLIDVLLPDEEFNVFRFKEMALEAMKGIYKRQHIPILTGGTGFYIQALLYDIEFKEEAHSQLRLELEKQAATPDGARLLYERLTHIDPVSAELIHPNNIKRVIRAIEYFEKTQTPISTHNEEQHLKQSAYQSCYFVLNDQRQRIYTQIEKRVDQMLADGLVEEVTRLRNMGYHKNMVSMQGLGYKEIFSYLEGLCSLEEAVYLIKRDTRRFAKRQLTWFRREKDVIWVNKDSFAYDNTKILDYMSTWIDKVLTD